MGQMVYEPFQYHLWMCSLKDHVPAKQSLNISGTYWYAFRDYWNFEEAGALEIRWGSIKLLKLRGQRGRPSRLVVNDNRECTLTDFYVINGIVPMYIQWEGELNHDDTITWTRTLIRKGWKLWGKTIDRPPIAEKYRKQPWKLSLPCNDETGDVLILERKGIGRLAYAKDSAFKS
jgi:hypothetical protein